MKKRLYCSKTDKKLCGVCAGVADYFGIDPTIVRVIWALLAFFYGTSSCSMSSWPLSCRSSRPAAA